MPVRQPNRMNTVNVNEKQLRFLMDNYLIHQALTTSHNHDRYTLVLKGNHSAREHRSVMLVTGYGSAGLDWSSAHHPDCKAILVWADSATLDDLKKIS